MHPIQQNHKMIQSIYIVMFYLSFQERICYIDERVGPDSRSQQVKCKFIGIPFRKDHLPIYENPEDAAVDVYIGLSPFPVIVAHEGLVRFPLKNINSWWSLFWGVVPSTILWVKSSEV